MATSFADILRQQQMLQQQGQQAQQSQGQGMAQLGQLGGKQLASALRGGGAGATGAGAGAQSGAAGFQLGQPLVTGQMGASSMAGGSAAGGAGAGGAGGAASSGMGAMFSNPVTAIIAAAALGSNYLHNKDISSWSDNLQGKAGGNMLDYYGGRKDGKTHGAIGKIVDKDGATGQSLKAVTDLSELDFSNAWKNAKDSVKSLFKLKLF